jgi:RHS repeat-associated protein
MTGTITLPSAGDWIFCVADNQKFTMTVDGNVVLTNIEYQLDGGDTNFNFQGNYTNTVSSNCMDAVLATGQHTIGISLIGSPAQATYYNVGYEVPGGSTVNGLPLSWLDPAYGLKTTTTDPDGKTTTFSWADSADHIGPEFGLLTGTTQDPNGLALTTTTSYEDPTQGGWLRRTTTTMPAANQISYSYYSGTGGPVAAACGVTSGTIQGGQLEQQTYPSPGGGGQPLVKQFIYDAAGRQVGTRVGTPADISSQPWQCVSYDTRGRIASQTWPAANGAPARTVTHSYAVGGNPLVSSVSDASGTITSTVDLLGRPVSYTDVWGLITLISYNQAGQVTTSNGPGGSAQIGYDPNGGQPTTTTVNGTLLATASYNSATGGMTKVTYGNGTTATFSYDTYGRQNGVTYTHTSGGSLLASDSVTFSLGGHETTETTSQPGTTNLLTISYGYDGAGRLTSATDTAGGTGTSTYSYAANPPADNCASPRMGANTNRTNVTTPAGTTDYCYNTAGQLVSTITAGTVTSSYAYNEHGDQTSDNGTTYTWDAADRPVTATTSGGATVTSTYDAVDRLIQASSSTGSTVRYSYAGYTQVAAAVLDTGNNILQQIVPLPGGATAILQPSGNTWAYANLQGDTIITTDNNGTRTSGPVTYDAWGQPTPGQAAPATTTGPNSLGAYATSGKLTDTATGTVLLGARTFNPAEARFLSADPVNGGCADLYTYAFGDPLTGSDLTGQMAKCHGPAVPAGTYCQGGLNSSDMHDSYYDVLEDEEQPTYCDILISPAATKAMANWIAAHPDPAPGVVGLAMYAACMAAAGKAGANGFWANATCIPIAGYSLIKTDDIENTIRTAAKAGDFLSIATMDSIPSLPVAAPQCRP